MNEIEVVPFAPWHVDAMKVRDVDISSEFHNGIAQISGAGPAVTILHAGRPMASMGCVIIHKGVAEAWVVADVDVKRIAKSLHKTTRWGLSEARRRYGIWRFSASVMQGRTENAKWLERLGFELESVMHKFGSKGETYLRYVLF